MKIKLSLFPFFLLVLACHNNSVRSGDFVNYSIGDLIITAPSETKFVKESGIDSYVAYIIDQKKDTFNIELGRRGIIDKLYLKGPSVFRQESKGKFTTSLGSVPTSEDAYFSDYPDEDEDQKIFEKNYFMYDTINGLVSKIVQPKRIGDGKTGIYIPKLKDTTLSFSMYALNLDSSSHRSAIMMFRTIRYRN